jgi:dye decolorizing peroxidase
MDKHLQSGGAAEVSSAAPSRRSLLGVGAAVAGGVGAGIVGYGVGSNRVGGATTVGVAHPCGTGVAGGACGTGADGDAPWAGSVVPFIGTHQAGITTTPQAHATFVALNLVPGVGAEGLRRLLHQWTSDASRLQRGIPTLGDPQPDLASPPSRLTVTVGLGRGALAEAGLIDHAPAWLAPLPAFSVDKLEQRWNDGDVLAQVCAEDPIVLAHAVRALVLSASGIATLHWQQRGFRRPVTSTSAMRNLMGQVDGTVQPPDAELDRAVWIGADGPDWLRGGTSLVIRRIRMELRTWDELDPHAKEQVIGRRMTSGAPLTGTKETDVPDLNATVNGLPVIAQFAHIRHAAVTSPAQMILRRPYNYDDPPPTDRTDDSGLLFAAYQRDPVGQFVPMQERLAANDLLNFWTTPIGSAVFAILPGPAEGESLGQALLG